jgi:exodeoxyribonuclease V alpha subunit
MTVACELNSIDRHFAGFIIRQSGKPSGILGCLASLVSSAVSQGSICLDLAGIAGRDIRLDGEELRLPPLEELRRMLRETAVVGLPGDFCPLILDRSDRLYLYRYWKYEQELAGVIREKSASSCTLAGGGPLAQALERLFPRAGGEIDWQRVAALAALRGRFCVISGGPGTGKTSTVVKILALLLELAGGEPPRIALAAPTGKAAARLRESISRMKERLECDETVRTLIPHEVSTIHRLLGYRPGSARFRHSERNPLPFHGVIVDEASMVALPLMAKLAMALRPDARLILLGDRDQLSSVEAGAALGDICGAGRREAFSVEFTTLYDSLSGGRNTLEAPGGPSPSLTDSLVILKKNYRFREESGIGALASLINAGRGDEALALVRGSGDSDLVWRDLPSLERLGSALTEAILDGYAPYLAAEKVDEALRRFDDFRLLCAMRQGAQGVAGVNALVERILEARGLIDPGSRWYRGRPVMITVNDYTLKLFNGDVGIVFPDPESGGRPMVHFPTQEGGIRTVSPVRLPAHETVFAMTVHKSQGSEFERILMLLPGHDAQVVTRELLYTGITRARTRVEIWGREELFVAGVSRRILRKSGLGEALWGTSGAIQPSEQTENQQRLCAVLNEAGP